jgi:hypothetical protein
LFLQAVNLPLGFGMANYQVTREVGGPLSRLDIVVERKGQFIIGIENKVGSSEILGLEDGEDQTQREWKDLITRGKELGVPRPRIKAFFLTADNHRPQSNNFRPISWRQIADVFERFAAKAKPQMVKLFARHYAEALRRDVVCETETQEGIHEYAKDD